jgi:hypothetical protein
MHANEKKREALKKSLRLGADDSVNSVVNKIFFSPRVQVNVLVVAWYLFTFALVILGIEVGVPIGVSLVISTLVISVGLFFVTLIFSWLNLMVFDPLKGLIALVFPFMLYRLFFRIWRFRFVSEEWSNHKGIVLAHLLSIFLFFGAIQIIPLVGNQAILRADRLFQKNYSFSPVKYLIMAGVVEKD